MYECARSVSQLILVSLLIKYCSTLKSRMEGFIVGGKFVNIEQYPHVAFLNIACNHNPMFYRCGSSILNQHFTLTAAHCVAECDSRKSHIGISVGDEDLRKGVKSSAKSYLFHAMFDPEKATADIGLVELKTALHLNTKIQRVVLTMRKKHPHNALAYVAGWGYVDDVKKKYSWKLKRVNQTVWSEETCSRILGRQLTRGTFCAGSVKGKDYAADGDSGSALIIKNYIQIGIVSHKVMTVSRSLIIYTSVGYYYNWIMTNTLLMHCS